MLCTVQRPELVKAGGNLTICRTQRLFSVLRAMMMVLQVWRGRLFGNTDEVEIDSTDLS